MQSPEGERGVKVLLAVSIWLTNHIGSFATEVLGGLGLGSGSQLVRLMPRFLLTDPQARYSAVVIAVGFCFTYELEWDPNGFEWKDVVPRLLGIAIALTLWFVYT